MRNVCAMQALWSSRASLPISFWVDVVWFRLKFNHKKDAFNPRINLMVSNSYTPLSSPPPPQFPRSYIVFAYLRDSEICFPTTPLIQFATTEATALPRTYLNRPVASIPASLAFLFFNDDEIITVRFSPQNGTAFHHREYSWLMKPPCFGASVSAYFVFLCGESMRYRGGGGLGGHGTQYREVI